MSLTPALWWFYIGSRLWFRVPSLVFTLWGSFYVPYLSHLSLCVSSVPSDLATWVNSIFCECSFQWFLPFFQFCLKYFQCTEILTLRLFLSFLTKLFLSWYEFPSNHPRPSAICGYLQHSSWYTRRTLRVRFISYTIWYTPHTYHLSTYQRH